LIRNARIIREGIINRRVLFFSIKIFFIAGSRSQATADVEIADIIINKKIIKI